MSGKNDFVAYWKQRVNDVKTKYHGAIQKASREAHETLNGEVTARLMVELKPEIQKLLRKVVTEMFKPKFRPKAVATPWTAFSTGDGSFRTNIVGIVQAVAKNVQESTGTLTGVEDLEISKVYKNAKEEISELAKRSFSELDDIAQRTLDVMLADNSEDNTDTWDDAQSDMEYVAKGCITKITGVVDAFRETEQ